MPAAEEKPVVTEDAEASEPASEDVPATSEEKPVVAEDAEAVEPVSTATACSSTSTGMMMSTSKTSRTLRPYSRGIAARNPPSFRLPLAPPVTSDVRPADPDVRSSLPPGGGHA